MQMEKRPDVEFPLLQSTKGLWSTKVCLSKSWAKNTFGVSESRKLPNRSSSPVKLRRLASERPREILGWGDHWAMYWNPTIFFPKKTLSQEQLKNIADFPRFLSLVEVCGGKSTWKWPPWWTSKKEKEQKCHHYVCGGRVERKRRRGGQYSPNQMPSKLPWPWPIDLQWTCTMSTLKSCCVCCTAALLISIRALKHLTQMRICMASPLKVLCQNVKY